MSTRIHDFIAQLELVDHHVHGAWFESRPRWVFETAINEASNDAPPEWMSYFDSQIGFAIRRYCSPLLGFGTNPSADEYWSTRTQFSEREIVLKMIRAAGVSDWIVDTGNQPDELTSPDELARISGGQSHEIVRLESLAADVVAHGATPATYADEFRDALAAATKNAVGVKSIAAYRCGLDIDWARPDLTQIKQAVQKWSSGEDGASVRLVDPVLIRFGIYAAADLGLPIQIHTGYGDVDEDLGRCNPLLLLDLLRQREIRRIPVTLLHTYPYHREAGYLAQAFPDVYFDIGLAINYLGVRSRTLVEESLELAPFAKILYSSDAFGPAELHYLGATLWRSALASVLTAWVEAGEWTDHDARRVATMIGRDNARRVYRL